MVADRVRYFTESVIRGMTRLANQYQAVNLGQGMPDFDPPGEVLEAACKAIRDGFNQYSITWGSPVLRAAIAEKVTRFNGIPCDPDLNVTVCCGATECTMAASLALVNPGDEVVIFQPFYENYGPDALLSGAVPKWVRLRPPDWSFDPDELRAAFSPKTKAVFVNSPNNPTGKVFTRAELTTIAGLCQEFDAYAIADEIYEHVIYTGEPHVSIGSLPGMAERTVTVSGMSKTFSVTGWRLGYCVAPPEESVAIRKVHDFMTCGAPHPLQMAAVAALALPQRYYDDLLADYRHRRSVLLAYLRDAGFDYHTPAGAYYVMCDYGRWCDLDDDAFAERLVKEVGVAGIPGGSFQRPQSLGRRQIRFMWAKREETLHEAGRRLQSAREKLG